MRARAAILLVPFSAGLIFGGNNERADLLFEEIMNSLPSEARVQVDSASRVNLSRPRADFKRPKANLKKATSPALSEDLKKKVEKTISEIESRKDERKPQFKEKKKKPK